MIDVRAGGCHQSRTKYTRNLIVCIVMAVSN
jgi:hypothetical protein